MTVADVTGALDWETCAWNKKRKSNRLPRIEVRLRHDEMGRGHQDRMIPAGVAIACQFVRTTPKSAVKWKNTTMRQLLPPAIEPAAVQVRASPETAAAAVRKDRTNLWFKYAMAGDVFLHDVELVADESRHFEVALQSDSEVGALQTTSIDFKHWRTDKIPLRTLFATVVRRTMPKRPDVARLLQLKDCLLWIRLPHSNVLVARKEQPLACLARKPAPRAEDDTEEPSAKKRRVNERQHQQQ
jgi:hypothetical protein